MSIKRKMKDTVTAALWRFGYVLTPIVIENDLTVKEEFAAEYAKVAEHTGAGLARSYALFKAIEYIIANNIEGDIVECGVWRGGSSMLAANTLLRQNVTDRKLYLYDTFEGMSAPTAEDFKLGRSDAAYTKDAWKKRQDDGHSTWCYGSLEQVKENMSTTGYPKENIVYVKGKVEDTLPGTLPKKIALLRLDTDFYESTKQELEHLYPLLSSGGVLLIDDYGIWQGSKQAVDEYFSTKQSPILLSRVDLEGRMGVKL